MLHQTHRRRAFAECDVADNDPSGAERPKLPAATVIDVLADVADAVLALESGQRLHGPARASSDRTIDKELLLELMLRPTVSLVELVACIHSPRHSIQAAVRRLESAGVVTLLETSKTSEVRFTSEFRGSYAPRLDALRSAVRSLDPQERRLFKDALLTFIEESAADPST